MHDPNTQRFHLSCQTPVGWLRAISNGSHLIYLYWNQIGWPDPDRPNHVSRETIAQLMAYFAGQRTNFTMSLRPDNISPTRQHWLNVMASIPYGTTISYAAFAAAGGELSTAGTACAVNPISLIYPCQRVVRKNGSLGHYGGGSQLSPSHQDNIACKGFLIAHEESQLDEG